MLASAMYELDSVLVDCILSKDGLLTVALAWLLEKNEVDYNAHVYGNEEYDFICKTPKGKLLIECKVHRTDVNERTFRGSLEQDAKQVSQQLWSLQKKEKAIRGFLVYNYEIDKFGNIAQEILKKFPNITLVDYRYLPTMVQQLKPK